MGRTPRNPEAPVSDLGAALINATGAGKQENVEPAANANPAGNETTGTATDQAALVENTAPISNIIPEATTEGPKQTILETGNQQEQNAPIIPPPIIAAPDVPKRRVVVGDRPADYDSMSFLVAEIINLTDDQLTAIQAKLQEEIKSRGINPQIQRLTVEEQETDKVVADLLTKYGANYVEAKRGGETQYFTRAAWSQLKQSRGGWQEVVKVPPEVLGLGK